MDIIEMLTEFNLTRTEATIFLALISEGDLNGYEVSKITGISRSNTYNSLAALVEKGGAYVIEGSAVKYTPVPIQEFCDNRIKKLQLMKKNMINMIPQKRDEVEGYITVRGERHILDKVSSMIAGAKERVYLSVSHEILEYILSDIESVIERGIKMVIITNKPLALKGATTYYAEKTNRQIGLIVDSANVLTGDIENGEYSTCLYSKKKNLIDLFKTSMKNEIRLIELMKGKDKE